MEDKFKEATDPSPIASPGGVTEGAGINSPLAPLPDQDNYTPPVVQQSVEELPRVRMPGLPDAIPSNLAGLTPKALAMRAHLMAQEKIGFMIPLDPLEKVGATESVTLNGYSLKIKKGEYVRIPIQVAEMLADSHNVTMHALNDNPANMNNPESVLNPGMQKSWAGL